MKHKIIGAISLFLVFISFVFAYTSIPDTVILYKDRVWDAGVSNLVIKDESIQASKGVIVPKEAGDYQASLSIFGIPYKSVTVKVIEEEEVIVGGQAIGIRIYSDGLLVIAVGRVNPNEKSPAEKAGIRAGDVIKEVNGEKIQGLDEFVKTVEQSQMVDLLIKRNEETIQISVTPEVSSVDNVKRIGLWVRDSTAGVGTMTYMTQNGKYGALGHAVSDVDTAVRFEVLHGSIEKCSIGDIKKGEKGEPGELRGVFYSGAQILGDIGKNEDEGIFGELTCIPEGDKVKLGHKSEIQKGKAYIRTSLDGNLVEEYEIEIMKVSKNSKNPTKGMVIQVTDEELIEKTGGIVQGMSGSPIIQNGKLIGAVTHVLVNDPTKGYGIFIENMLEAAE